MDTIVNIFTYEILHEWNNLHLRAINRQTTKTFKYRVSTHLAGKVMVQTLTWDDQHPYYKRMYNKGRLLLIQISSYVMTSWFTATPHSSDN